MFSVTKKSWTFSCLPHSANVQVCRSWEGAQPGRPPKLADGNIPYHGRHAQFMNEGWGRRGQESPFFNSLFCEFESSLVWAFKLIQEFGLFQEFCEIHDFQRSLITAHGLAVARSLGSEQTVLSIVCSAYSLLSLLLAVVVFPLLSY